MEKEYSELKEIFDKNKVLETSLFPFFYQIMKESEAIPEIELKRRQDKLYLLLCSLYKYYIAVYFLVFKIFSRRYKMDNSKVLATINSYRSNRYVNGKKMDSYIEPLLGKYKIDSNYIIDDRRDIRSIFSQNKKYMPWITFLSFKDMINVWKDYRKIKKSLKNISIEGYLKKAAIFNGVLFIYLANNSIEKIKPKLVIMSCEYTLMNEAIIAICKNKDIKTLGIQHGVIYPEHAHYKNIDENYLVPDYFIVYSDKEKKVVEKVMKSKIMPLGRFQYDDSVNNSNKEIKGEFKRKHSISPDKKVVLFHSQTHGYDGKDLPAIEQLFDFFKNKEEFEFIIKLHPSEDQKAIIFKELNKKYGTNFKIFDGKQDNLLITSISDYEIAAFSSATEDALIMDKVVVFIDVPHPEARKNFFLKEGLGPLIKDDKDLEYIFNINNYYDIKNKYELKIKRFVKKKYYYLGTSGKEHIKLINKLLHP